MTVEEWVADQIEKAPPLSAEQTSRVQLLLAGAAHNIEASAQAAVTGGESAP